MVPAKFPHLMNKFFFTAETAEDAEKERFDLLLSALLCVDINKLFGAMVPAKFPHLMNKFFFTAEAAEDAEKERFDLLLSPLLCVALR
jgi:hypothetical protein